MTKYDLQFQSEDIKFPPWEDIIVIGKTTPHGVYNMSKCIEVLSNDEHSIVKVNEENIDAIIINKKILKKIPQEILIDKLKATVFPTISPDEIIKIDLKIKLTFSDMKGEF